MTRIGWVVAFVKDGTLDHIDIWDNHTSILKIPKSIFKEQILCGLGVVEFLILAVSTPDVTQNVVHRDGGWIAQSRSSHSTAVPLRWRPRSIGRRRVTQASLGLHYVSLTVGEVREILTTIWLGRVISFPFMSNRWTVLKIWVSTLSLGLPV